MMNSSNTGDSNRGKNIIISHNSTGEPENDSKSRNDDTDHNAVSGDVSNVYQDNSDRKKKICRRHSPEQIQELEKMFAEYPYPDEKQILELSHRLKLDTRQVKFWFQNHRTQLKGMIERYENSILRKENEKLRAENFSAREAMSNPTCNNCGGPTFIEEIEPDQQQLIVENACLKAELENIRAIAGKFLNRPIVNSSPSFNLSSGHSSGSCQIIPAVPDYISSLENDKVVVSSSNTNRNVGVGESSQKSNLLELASAAMDELMKMVQIEEPLWLKYGKNGREILNFEEYGRRFGRCIGPKPVGYVVEASRESGVVIANSKTLVDILMDADRWLDMFPCLIAKTATTEVISSGMGGTKNGALQLMEASLQVLSPFVPVRDVKFLRFCRQHADGVWAIVDVCSDGIHEFSTVTNRNMSCRRLPSGCILQDMPNGYSKVTWVEHAEYDESRVHNLYRPLIKSGFGFGAQRWLTSLQYQCECHAILVSYPSILYDFDQTGVTTSGRRSLVKLAQRMTKNLLASISASSLSSVHKWSQVVSDGKINENIRIISRQSINDCGEPNGVVLNAATSVSLPLCPTRIFDFLRDASTRSRWDIIADGRPMQEMCPIYKGLDSGNAVSLLSTSVDDQNRKLILQETRSDASGSLVVYAPVNTPDVHLMMSGGDSACVNLLPSGFFIIPDGPCDGSSTPGALLTVAFQILVNSAPNAKLSAHSVQTVNNLLSSTVQIIKDGVMP